MIFCPRCSFRNSSEAVMCAGPGCGERLVREEAVCRIHRLPMGAVVCHICAAQAASSPPAGVRDPALRGKSPARYRETVDLRAMMTPVADASVHEGQPPERAVPNAYDKAEQGAAEPERPAHVQPATPQGDTPAAPTPPRPTPARLAGLLVTYTWNSTGQIIPLRQGLNRIGSSPDCEVHVPDDAMLSALHASIHVRRGFLINDLDSEHGTQVNGEPIDERYVRLENYSRITAGKTTWTFLMIEPPPSEASSDS